MKAGKYFTRLSVLGLILTFQVFASLHAPIWCSPEYRQITILHTNDTHGHLLPFSFPDPGNEAERSQMPQVLKNVGGIARRTTLARQIEAEMKGNVLLLDAGDALDGTPFSIEYMGEADFAAMKVAGYDAATIGNHEFSASIKEFERNIQTLSIPVVSANLVDRRTGEKAVLGYQIFDMDGVKVAIFGLTTSATGYKAAKEAIDFLDYISVARELVPELRQKADIVVALTHIGLDEDERLAKEVPGIDIIVGGHSHTRLAQPQFIRRDPPSAFSVGGTVIVQDFQWGAELGRLDLRLRRNDGPFTLMSFNGCLIPITSSIPEDYSTAKIVSKYYAPVAKKYDEIIGEASDDFLSESSGGESAMLNLVCDAFRESTGAQVAIYNTGGIRGDIVSGPVKMWDLATVLPFKNKLVEIEITGARLKRALEEEKPGVSGLRYRIKNGKLIESTIDGKPVEDQTIYRVATIDFLFGNTFIDITDHKVLFVDYRDAVKKYIKTHAAVSPVLDGRMSTE